MEAAAKRQSSERSRLEDNLIERCALDRTKTRFLSARYDCVVLYSVSKFFWLIIQPVHLWLLLIALGTGLLFTNGRRLGLGLLAIDALLILIVVVLPVGNWLIAPLENRFPPLSPMPVHVDGIIMLGGDEDVAFADLAKLYPNAKLVFAGGGMESHATSSSQWMGIDTSRITFEPQSRNTFEDVVEAKAVVRPAPDEIWILVTPAFHMPRSVGLFHAQGWQVVPDPVGHQTSVCGDDAAYDFDFEHNLALLSVALKEWIGMLANRLLGHSESFFPGPARAIECRPHHDVDR